MLETSARLLRLLSLLQTRRDWAGGDLADRLGVSARTVRRDVDRLRQLGYPVHASTGIAGGYRPRARGAPPPPPLRDEGGGAGGGRARPGGRGARARGGGAPVAPAGQPGAVLSP